MISKLTALYCLITGAWGVFFVFGSVYGSYTPVDQQVRAWVLLLGIYPEGMLILGLVGILLWTLNWFGHAGVSTEEYKTDLFIMYLGLLFYDMSLLWGPRYHLPADYATIRSVLMVVVFPLVGFCIIREGKIGKEQQKTDQPLNWTQPPPSDYNYP